MEEEFRKSTQYYLTKKDCDLRLQQKNLEILKYKDLKNPETHFAIALTKNTEWFWFQYNLEYLSVHVNMEYLLLTIPYYCCFFLDCGGPDIQYLEELITKIKNQTPDFNRFLASIFSEEDTYNKAIMAMIIILGRNIFTKQIPKEVSYSLHFALESYFSLKKEAEKNCKINYWIEGITLKESDIYIENSCDTTSNLFWSCYLRHMLFR